MRAGRLLLLGVWIAVPAQAEVRFHLDVGGFFRSVPSIDLADLAGETGYGTGDDAAGAAAGIRLGFGMEYAGFEVAVDAGLGAGGLDLGAIERRYLGQVDDVGSSTTLAAGLRFMWVPEVTEGWQVLLGPQGMWHVMGAASGAGQASVSSLGFGGLAGFRWMTQAITPTLDGGLQVTVDGMAHLPLSTSVRRSTEDVLFENDAPEGVFPSWGINASYFFTFK